MIFIPERHNDIMKARHTTKNLQEAMEVFMKELQDPKEYKIAVVIEHFEVAGNEIMLRAQKAKDESGPFWVIENLDSPEKIAVHN